MPDGRPDLRKAPQRLVELLVEDAAVGDHDDAVEDVGPVRLARSLQPDQLVSKPRDAVGFAATSRVLDQIAPPGAVPASITQKLPHHVQLVIARENLDAFGRGASSPSRSTAPCLITGLEERVAKCCQTHPYSPPNALHVWVALQLVAQPSH